MKLVMRNTATSKTSVGRSGMWLVLLCLLWGPLLRQVMAALPNPDQSNYLNPCENAMQLKSSSLWRRSTKPVCFQILFF